MNTFLKTNYEIKRSRCDRSINNTMIIPVAVHQTNKKVYVTVQPKNACKL